MAKKLESVAFVGCSKKKLWGVHEARELYASNHFNLAYAYAAKKYDRVYILSGKHGLLEPSRRIRHYDVSLARMPIAERRQWAERVAAQIRASVPEHAGLTFFCGKQYHEFLIPALVGWEISIPFEHVRRGMQMQKLRQWLG